MKRALAILLSVAGCSDSPEDRLDELRANPGTECLRYEWCANIVRIDDAKLCMNNALYRGERALATWSMPDAQYYDITTYVFADDRQVKSFVSMPDGAGGYDIIEEPPCGDSYFSVSMELLCPVQGTQPLLSWYRCP